MGIGTVRRLLRTEGAREDLHGRLLGGLRAEDGRQEGVGRPVEWEDFIYFCGLFEVRYKLVIGCMTG